MFRTARTVVLAASAAMLLATILAGGVGASSPKHQYAHAACWTGATVFMSQTWSGFKVDGYDFGASSADGGLGFADTTSGRSGSVDSSGLTIDDTFDTAGGELTFHGRILESFTIDRPSSGHWSDLPPC